jgi:hypothetical protein
MSEKPLLRPGDVSVVTTRGAVRPRYVLFVGGPSLERMNYEALGRFASSAVRAAAEIADVDHLSLIAHGPGFGLDGIESAKTIALGALEGHEQAPRRLSAVTLIERSGPKAKAMEEELTSLFGPPSDPAGRSGLWVRTWPLAGPRNPPDEPVGRDGDRKPHAFVAIPFSEDYEDIFNFGIQAPVRSLGLVCERVDKTAFTGDVVQRIRERIEAAAFVVADLTEGNPNVYLELGFAWGVGKPTILVTRDAEEDLPFDVRGQRALRYRSATTLQALMESELQGLRRQGVL